MNPHQRAVGAVALALAVLLPGREAGAVQNWFGYGGTFGPRAYYTYYAPTTVVSAGYAPTTVTSYSYPTVVSSPVVNYAASPVIAPTITYYAPVATAYAPVTSCRPVVAYYQGSNCRAYAGQCASYCGTPAIGAPVTVTPAPITVTPAPTTVTPLVPQYGTPIYQPPGVYTPAAPTAPPVTAPVSPGLPTSSVSPADQPPVMSGFAPLDATTIVPPTTVDVPATSPSGPAAPAASETSPSKSDQLKPDLDISVPNADEEELTPVEPPDAAKEQENGAATGPRLEGDDANTAAAASQRTGLLSTATWRAVRPSSRKLSAARQAGTQPAASR